MSILIVDDNMVFGRSLLRALECLGYAGRAVSSVDDALRSLAFETPGLLLSDFELGEVCSGVDLAVWARNAYRVPVVLMTGADPWRVREELGWMGLPDVEVLSKPFSFDELAAALARHRTDDHPWLPMAQILEA